MIYLEKRLPSSFSENPLLAEFMNVYYKYASERDNALGIVNYTPENRDVDTAIDNYLENFYSTYANHLKNPKALDKNTLIKFLNAIYSAKGSARALNTIFQVMFGEVIDISYPSENILKASDGVWIQEKFITTTTSFGTFLSIDTVEFNNEFGYFVIKPTRIEQISGELTRIYFESYEKIYVIDNQEVFAYSSERVITFAGNIVKSTDKLLVRTPGQAWQLGQVILIPGTVKDTVARVTSVDVNDGISSIEIIEYGYVHTPGQITTISPYPNKPNNSEISIDSVLVSINPDVYNHTINIIDYMDGVYENLTGTDNNGATRISYLSSPDKTYIEVNDDLTIGEWLDSRAVLYFTESNLVSTRGYFEDARGQLSNSEMRLEDNFYYQVYSYLVETHQDIKDYSEILKITHPAGLKMFSKLNKQSYFTIQTESSRTLSNDLIYVLDIANILDDILGKQVSKTISDLDSVVYGTDSLNNFTVDKILADLIDTSIWIHTLSKEITKTISELDSVVYGTDTLNNFTVDKILADLIDTSIWSHILDKQVSKTISDLDSVVYGTDSLNNFTVDKILANETVTIIDDVPVITPVKGITDSVTASNVDTFNTVIVPQSSETYALEDYFSETYAGIPNSITLTIQ